MAAKQLIKYLTIIVFVSVATLCNGQGIQAKNAAVIIDKYPSLLELKSPNFKSIGIIKSSNTYMPTLGIMCRLEEQLTKTAKIPVKLRLGSKDYVDKLENKRKF